MSASPLVAATGSAIDKRLTAWLVCGALVVIPSCGTADLGPPADHSRCAEVLHLSVSIGPKPSWHRGPGPMVRVQLKNDGRWPIWIDRSSKLRFEVRDATGAEVPFGGTRNEAMTASYGLLGPGEDLRAQEDIGIHHAMASRQRYSVTAHFEDVRRDPTPPPPGVCALGDVRLASPPIFFESAGLQ